MDPDGKTKKKLVIFILAILIATFLIIIGIVLLCVHTKTLGTETKVDYTECEDDSVPGKKCAQKQSPPSGSDEIPFCVCYTYVNLSEPNTAPVTVYYELPDYDQTRAGYASSRDDTQLAGNLSSIVSPNCGNYSYVDTPEGKKPIAPCGEIADSMLHDQYTLIYNSSIVPSLEIGLDGITEEDKKKYRNPPGDLQAAFKDFAKPKSWRINVTQLDVTDSDNNAFQNERFIGWMKTDMKRKPAIRINHTGIFEAGLPAGSYKLRVMYYPSNYTGPRIAIISSLHTVTSTAQLIAGILLLLIGICLVSIVAYYRIVHRSYVPCKTEPE